MIFLDNRFSMTQQLEETLLRKARKLRKWKSAKAAAEAYGWPVSTYISNENGTMPFSFEAAERYAKAFRVNATSLYKNKGDLTDESESVAEEYNIVHGIIRAGRGEAMIDMSDTQIQPEYVKVIKDEKSVYLRISGDSMAPKYEDGETLEFGRVFYDAAELIGKRAWVTLDTGEELFKIIRAGTEEGKFILLSLNSNYEPLININILKARPLLGVKYWS